METREIKFKTIISDYQDMIYRLCCSYVEDVDIRKDLYQNILIRIWRGLASFEKRSSISTWVYRISVNTGIDFLRKEVNNTYTSKHVDINNIEITDKISDMEENLIQSEKTKYMYKCINTLSYIDKTIISLYLEDLTYREIADIVGISVKNISVKLYRIKKQLTKCLKDI
jgi:RNA polymerase sigma-70 factor (ECF subfamily)